jgi:hypothetical protein
MEAFNGEVYFQRGPLVYAHAIPHEEKTIKTYDRAGFRDYYSFPTKKNFKPFTISTENISTFEYESLELSDGENPWYRSGDYLTGYLTDVSGKNKQVKLVPLGSTVLRQVTFKPIK